MTFIPLPIMTSVPYYRTEQGEAYLGDSLNLMEELPDKSVNLIFTRRRSHCISWRQACLADLPLQCRF